MDFRRVSKTDYIYRCGDKKLFLRYGNKNSKYSKHLIIKSLTSELYVNGWLLKGVLSRYLVNGKSKDFNIVLVSSQLNKNFIGLLFTQYFSKDKTVTMYFVKDEYRREGIASMMIEFCKSKNITLGKGRVGVEGSKLFFKKHNIDFIY